MLRGFRSSMVLRTTHRSAHQGHARHGCEWDPPPARFRVCSWTSPFTTIILRVWYTRSNNNNIYEYLIIIFVTSENKILYFEVPCCLWISRSCYITAARYSLGQSASHSTCERGLTHTYIYADCPLSVNTPPISPTPREHRYHNK